jgi:MFS family permease
MSYITPVYIQESINSTLLMGIILSFSSVIGFICDLVFSELFRGRSYSFFIILGMSTAFAFPIVFLLLPPWVIFYLVAMLIWGLYYEFFIFADFHFIHTFTDKSLHATSWGILSTFKSAAYLIGPIVATSLIEKGTSYPLIATLGFTAIALFTFLLFLKLERYTKTEKQLRPHKKSIIAEFKIWRVILKRIWPIYIFIFTLSIMDSAFWTVGTLLSEEMREITPIGGFLLTAYMLPSIILGFLAGRAARPYGKKRAAFISGILGGLVFTFTGFVQNIPAFVFSVFIAATVMSLAWPEISAVIEDYVSRLGDFGNDIIGLQSSSASLAYIVGPILSGAIATIIGNKLTFSAMGIILLMVSVMALLVVPRKIKMPISELNNL